LCSEDSWKELLIRSNDFQSGPFSAKLESGESERGDEAQLRKIVLDKTSGEKYITAEVFYDIVPLQWALPLDRSMPTQITIVN
jgi:hypothetical protein